MATDPTYSLDFYNTIRSGVQSSADVIVPMLVDGFHPRYIVDVGCGEGWWARRFADAGVPDYLGVDGEYARRSQVLGDNFQVVDLAQPVPFGTIEGSDGISFDMAVCLEVAEHLPPERASRFIAELCSLAPVVVFSAAIPGQGGAGHLNEQPQSYWARLFAVNDRRPLDTIRPKVWHDDRVEPWYAQNLLVYVPEDRGPGFHERAFQLDIVHPTIFGWALAAHMANSWRGDAP